MEESTFEDEKNDIAIDDNNTTTSAEEGGASGAIPTGSDAIVAEESEKLQVESNSLPGHPLTPSNALDDSQSSTSLPYCTSSP